MRNFLLAALMLLSVCATAQVNNSFRGTLNVFSATGLAPNYRVTGFFSDANGYYSSDSCQVGDVIFAFYTTTCVRFVVDSIITKAGSIITADVIDVDSITAAFPFGVTAIMRETAVNGYPVNISGISGPLASCIETHFKGLIDVLQTGIGGAPGNSQDTIIQVAHGLSLLDPVHVDTSGLWIVSNVSSDDSLHMAVVTEVISADTLILTYNGLTEQQGHGYTVGSVYFVQDDGTYATTVPTNFINDIAFYVVSDSTLYITEQRPISPMTDLNGIYATSDTVPSGTIATANNFQFKWGDNYYISFNPDNDNISMRGDSTLFYLGIDGAIITDNNASKRGLEYAASGYVTQPLSLTTKEYVDNAIAAIPTDNIYTADGTTIDANRVVEVSNNISFVDTLTNEFGVKITTPLFSEEVAIGRLDATSGTKATLSESKNNIELRGNATDPLKLAFLEETAQGTNFSVIRARDTLSSNTDFILPNSNGSYAQVLTTDGQGRTAWDYIDSDNIQDGTITTADLAFTPLQGSGTSGRIPRYTSANTLSDGVLRDDGTLLALGGATVSGYSFYDYSTGGWRLATGTTAQRPTNAAGVHRYNTSLGYSETANGSEWLQSDLPIGTDRQTLRHNGTSWIGNSYILSDGGYNQFGGTSWGVKGSNTFYKKNQSTLGAAIVAFDGTSADGYRTINSDGTNLVANGATSSFTTTTYPGIIGVGTNDSYVIRGFNMVGVLGVTGQSTGGNNADYIGVYGQAILRRTQVAATTGPHIGVYGLAGSTQTNLGTLGVYYGLLGQTYNWGAVVNSTGYGVYGASYLSTTNWGFYNPAGGGNNAFAGNTIIGGVSTPARTLHVTGEARITDLTTDTPTRIVGANADGDLGAVSEGYGINVTGGALEVDTTQIVSVIGLTTLFTGGADITVANTVTETTLIPTGTGTVTLPANFLVVGKTIKIDAWGVWTADATPSTLELRAELGGTLLCTTGANTMVTSEGGQWHAEIIFTCRSTGVSGTTFSQGEVRMSSAVDTHKIYWMRRSALNTINTTTSNAIDFTATHGAADPDNSITLTNITITVLN